MFNARPLGRNWAAETPAQPAQRGNLPKTTQQTATRPLGRYAIARPSLVFCARPLGPPMGTALRGLAAPPSLGGGA
jgi:hypothetical protein